MARRVIEKLRNDNVMECSAISFRNSGRKDVAHNGRLREWRATAFRLKKRRLSAAMINNRAQLHGLMRNAMELVSVPIKKGEGCATLFTFDDDR